MSSLFTLQKSHSAQNNDCLNTSRAVTILNLSGVFDVKAMFIVTLSNSLMSVYTTVNQKKLF